MPLYRPGIGRQAPAPALQPNPSYSRCPQCHPDWCWAACTEMILSAHGNGHNQCQIDKADRAARTIAPPLGTAPPPSVPCQDPAHCQTPQSCNRAIHAADVGSIYGNFLFQVRFLPSHLRLPDLVAALGRGPVEVGIVLVSNLKGHLALVTESNPSPAGPRFRVLDPDRGHGQNGAQGVDKLHSEIVTWSQTGIWRDSWTDIKP